MYKCYTAGFCHEPRCFALSRLQTSRKTLSELKNLIGQHRARNEVWDL